MIKIHDFSVFFALSIIATFFTQNIYSVTIDFKNHEEVQELINLDQSEQERYLQELAEVLRKPQAKEIFEGLQVTHVAFHSQKIKKWTILIYIAGDNDLYKFALRNIEQMKQIGSSSTLNIVIHFDYHREPKQKKTRRFFVERNQLLEIGENSAMDSGSEQTLINAAQWATTNYPSEHFGIVLWNHGSGDLNPARLERLINPAELFYYDATSNQIVLDRSISFMDFLMRKASERGICFDNTTGNYLNDQKLALALHEITKMRNNSKIDIVLMDACLMAGIGTAYLLSKYVNYMTASEEVVLGPGYNYATMLRPLSTKFMSPEAFARHAVEAYNQTYGPITQDYTESAFDLSYIEQLAENSNTLANLILHFSEFDPSKSILRTIKLCASKDFCTHFDEPSYVDFLHFYNNLLIHCSRINVKDYQNNDFYSELTKIIKQGIYLHEKTVISSVSGKNYPKAEGISIYFPQKMHSSFENTFFGKKYTRWLSLISLMSNLY